MEGNIFFVSWALWQQMTFVLGMAILAVFFAGLVKLWWISRLLKKQEVLDEEKKARIEEMRRTGIPPKRANDIPFGIRAIQSGVEVVGIWISRPDSPNHAPPTKAPPSVTIVNLDSEKSTDSSDDLKILPVPTTKTPPPGIPPPADSTDSGTPLSQNPPHHAPGQGTTMLSEDTLRKLEGQSRQQQQQPPYIRMSAAPPPTSRRHHLHLSQRSSESSASGESLDSQPRSFRTASGRSYTDSSRSSRLYMARGSGRATYGGLPPLVGWQLDEGSRGDPFGTPPYSRFSQQREGMTPEPQGEGVQVARVARRVNEGFEVLPAGTFARLDGTSSTTEGSEAGGEWNGGRAQRKLRKKSIGAIEEGGMGTGQVVA